MKKASNSNNNMRQHTMFSLDDTISRDMTISQNSDYDETEQALLRAFEVFFARESEMILSTLEESREHIKSTIDELVYEQDKHKEELFNATDGKYDSRRKKENAIPLSEYIKKKRNLASARASSGMVPITSTPLNDDISNDRLAVEKYLKKRERQKIAESNRLKKEKTETELENETKNILEKLKGIDLTSEKERQRQLEKIQSKLKGKPKQIKDNHLVASEIIEDYHDSQMAYEREKKQQQQKFQSRLNATRDKRAITPTGRDLTDSDLREYGGSSDGKKIGKNIASVDI